MNKIRVVAYCRVSDDDQKTSYEAQKQYWEEYINKNKNYTLVDIYADEGISGTNVFKRDEFNRMIRDAIAKKYDLILTKEVSRFARNTVDCLKYTRKLKDLGIGVFFETDNINTLDNDGELRLSLMATLAQEESRKTSMRVKWGHKRAMERGVVYGADRILGYDRDNKTLKINEREAEIIRTIYNWFYYEDESLHGIVKRLKNELGITKGKLGGKLDKTAIKRILTNEKYCGDLIQRKYIVENYLTHKQIINTKEPKIIKQNIIPDIIEKELWIKVQEKLKERQNKLNKGVGYSRTIWSGKLICGECGSKYRKRTLKNKDGSPRPIWKCKLNYHQGSKECTNGSYIKEELLEKISMNAFKKISNSEDSKIILQNLILVLQINIEKSNDYKELENLKKQLSQIQTKKEKLLDLYLDEKLSKTDYEKKNITLNNNEEQLQTKIFEIENRESIFFEKKNKINRFIEILNKQKDFDEFNSKLIEEFLDKIIIYKKKATIYFNIEGLDSIEVDLGKHHKGSIESIIVPLWVFEYNNKHKRGNVSCIDKWEIEVLISA